MSVPRMLLVLLVSFVGVSPAHAAPQNGWWWNANEGGRGFFIEIQGEIAYIGAYVYASDGRADWVVSQGLMTSPTSYSGRLLSFRGGQTLVGSYKGPGPATDAGAISIVFHGDTTATLTWPGGTVAIERLIFDGTPSHAVPRTGWWWSPAEGGTGFSIEAQGATLFLVGFMYDASGNPLWYYSAGPMTDEGRYAGTLLQFAGGQAIGGPYRAPAAPMTVGSVQLSFTASDRATLTLSDGAAVDVRAPTKAARAVPLVPILSPPMAPLPRAWRGTVRKLHKDDSTDPIARLLLDRIVTMRVLVEDTSTGPAPSQRTYAWLALADITVTGTVTSTASDGSRIVCAISGGRAGVPLGSGSLTVDSSGSYRFSVIDTVSYSQTEICPAGVVATTTEQLDFSFTRSGRVDGDRITGYEVDEHDFGILRTVDVDIWEFQHAR